MSSACDLLRIIWMEFHRSYLPDDAINVSEYGGEDDSDAECGGSWLTMPDVLAGSALGTSSAWC